MTTNVFVGSVVAPGPKQGTAGQTTNKQHYATLAGKLNPAMLAHRAAVRTIFACRSDSPAPRGYPVKDGEAYDVGCRTLERDETDLPGSVRAPVQCHSSGCQAKHRVTIRQGVRWIQRPRDAGLRG